MGALTSRCPPTGLRTSISRAWGAEEEGQSWQGPARRHPASVSPPCRPLTQHTVVDRGDPSLSPTSPYAPQGPGSPEPRTPGPPGSAPCPPTHLSGRRTPTHRRLRLRTAAAPKPAPPGATPARKEPPRALAVILRKRVNYSGGRGGK